MNMIHQARFAYCLYHRCSHIWKSPLLGSDLVESMNGDHMTTHGDRWTQQSNAICRQLPISNAHPLCINITV